MKSFKNKKYFKLARFASRFVGAFYMAIGVLYFVTIIVGSIFTGTQPHLNLEFTLHSISLFVLGEILYAASKLFNSLINVIDELEKTI